MIGPLIKKLNHYMDISDKETQLLIDSITRTISINRGENIITEGSKPGETHLMLEGWACRYKLMGNGKFHIMAYLIPGDLCDVHVAILDQMDHSIRTLTPATVACIPHEKIDYIMEHHYRLARALFWSTLVDEAILREWLVSTGHRSADRRLAHVFCELLVRSRSAGLSDDNSFNLPLTQEELGDSMGMTVVHTNRVIQKLRSEGLITLQNKRLVIHDWERMVAFAEFNPNYLHRQKSY
ncbi:Crp/Fnr family transcriptional regulator [Phytohalomonas tamaricis]|uniref:Crp/Fnr family transcriptional regulator n=1 Tax=Phytohalomonas tamaricis TaxID=2081032 RepID=UPI000D0B22F3|nr:Crp/Fnr family transcriptional regulator [Phytohalomonas tamaricis]